MPRTRPQLSITLPRNFTFHYTEGEDPKTPDREIPIPVPQSPRPSNAYHFKRRSRPGVNSTFQDNKDSNSSSDIPIATIETPIVVGPTRPVVQQRATEPAEGHLAPFATRPFMTLPRTPVLQQRRLALADGWNASNQQDLGDSITRPMSTCSLLSDSSEDSNGSLTSYPAGDGSCTSPESDAPDPFKFASIRKIKAKEWATLARNDESIQCGMSTKQVRVNWTREMDKHLWSIYHIYLQDPTVTPFKMLPGTAPPLGVCHRIAREAKRSWRGAKTSLRNPSTMITSHDVDDRVKASAPFARRPDSPDTIRADRSGSNTPTGSATAKPPLWPKSSSSTRRRLRHLCKTKPTIAPHYQRLLQSRSPSPFSSGSRSQSRSQSRLSEVSSFFEKQTSSFNTRDIQLSLTTSTAASMQPRGPLAQLGSENATSSQPQQEWFNEPPVPWASPTAIPSDVIDVDVGGNEEPMLAPPPLGSPFGYHTWGPSRSRQRLRPSTSRIQSSDASTLGPSLRSPVRFSDTFPYPGAGVQKRRARYPLEDELSPGGSSMQQSLLDNLFGSPAEGRHRRVRSRGFSLGDVNTLNPLESLFTPPHSRDGMADASDGTPEGPSPGPAEPRTPIRTIRRLGSPFHLVPATPSRGPSRHLATMSLGGHQRFTSIGETLGQANDETGFTSRLNR
ncbi:MAG: hypothetical protein ALECFALPRED_003352 [Alectoria fallacina]|uniref:Uncharacterized protein n=1 Tax=Alectoria fallacina TaxID=1903189 RepID=A0A8H3FK69_9LECA|nr:MAG: hypothetical protein ALECFALPRED_003352 [Alectoria fallacina]